ncbi:hypothetical protein GQ42DRAFT_163154 [Ramicandelaber brevisporus]|nr:hypothetical protein GQ42DRAFT_163154 [Ramicandelaber brevisporus]
MAGVIANSTAAAATATASVVATTVSSQQPTSAAVEYLFERLIRALRSRISRLPRHIYVFDFDNTLFRTPEPNPHLWTPPSIGRLRSEEIGWYHDPLPLLTVHSEMKRRVRNAASSDNGTLGVDNGSERRSNRDGGLDEFWNSNVVEKAVHAHRNEDALSVLLTGRGEIVFREILGKLVNEMPIAPQPSSSQTSSSQPSSSATATVTATSTTEEIVRELFDLMILKERVVCESNGNEPLNTLKFKQRVLETLADTFGNPSLELFEVYEDREHHAAGIQATLDELAQSGRLSGAGAGTGAKQPTVRVVLVDKPSFQLDVQTEWHLCSYLIHKFNKRRFPNYPLPLLPFKSSTAADEPAQLPIGSMVIEPQVQSVSVTLPYRMRRRLLQRLYSMGYRDLPVNVDSGTGSIVTTQGWRGTNGRVYLTPYEAATTMVDKTGATVPAPLIPEELAAVLQLNQQHLDAHSLYKLIGIDCSVWDSEADLLATVKSQIESDSDPAESSTSLLHHKRALSITPTPTPSAGNTSQQQTSASSAEQVSMVCDIVVDALAIVPNELILARVRRIGPSYSSATNNRMYTFTDNHPYIVVASNTRAVQRTAQLVSSTSDTPDILHPYVYQPFPNGQTVKLTGCMVQANSQLNLRVVEPPPPPVKPPVFIKVGKAVLETRPDITGAHIGRVVKAVTMELEERGLENVEENETEIKELIALFCNKLYPLPAE